MAVLPQPGTPAAAQALRGQAMPQLPAAPCGCDKDPIEGLKQLFVDFAQGRALASGRDPASRPVFLRQHGVCHGVFRVHPDLPGDLRVGLFAAAAEYPVWARFSADVQPGVPDLKGTTGVALKLFGVPGAKLLPGEESASTHDFIFQNHDVFFADDARAMCEFTCEALHGRAAQYFQRHPDTQRILDEMEHVVASTLATDYWSVLPFRFGDRFVKYKLEPEGAPPPGDPPDFDDPAYLRADLAARLAQGEARFRFLLQFQASEAEMPLDRATVRWSEEASRPIHVATLVLAQQDVRSRGQDAYGENLAFNTWCCLAEHAPEGTLAQARKVVYQASAANRRNVNGVALAEPAQPRPVDYAPGEPYPAAKDRRIVRAAIHPAIGVARVGDSADCFLGPQVLEPPRQDPSFYRDARGALKRQAAQFRIYGYNAAGEVVREITADWALVKWQVHFANKKAAWYRWRIAMDVPEAASVAMPLRNAAIRGDARRALEIDCGRQSIGGRGQALVLAGAFQGNEVSLGELRTDDAGRLEVLAGRGVSQTFDGSPIFVRADEDSFGNAEGWHDDVGDGPVTAEVSIEGTPIPVEPAWVLSAPANYAPRIKGVRSLYDLLFDLYVRAGWLPFPATISYREHVHPILQRLSGLQWVNAGFAAQFGHGGPFDFGDPRWAERLGRRPPAGTFDADKALRREIANNFRSPGTADGNQVPWPWLYGDAMEVVARPGARQNATLTDTQWRILKLWAEGTFEGDWEAPAAAPARIEDVPLADQPGMLDRAALEFCLADAFHPGCEVTWPVRHLSLYARPFRIRHAPSQPAHPRPVPATLTQQAALAADGPLHAQGPGDLTRWMALPWQADTAFCRAGYNTRYDPFIPSFWPAHVPNQVIAEADYAVLMDASQPMEQRIAAFMDRASWNDPIDGGDTASTMLRMVRIFGSMGLVSERDGPTDTPLLPTVMQVASYGPDVAPAAAQAAVLRAAGAPAAAAAHAAPAAAPLPRGANFRSHESAEDAPVPVRPPRR